MKSLLLCLALVGCAHQQPQSQQQPTRCTGAVEVFPNGMTPRRPYRVIGPLQTRVIDNQTTAAEQVLVRDACQMGADAIIVDPQDLFAQANSDPGALGGRLQNTSYLAATAVAYTDGAAPAQ
jgi:hypothetical protein